MKPILSSTTEKCLAHLDGVIGGKEDYYERRDAVARFVGVDSGTVRRWVKKDNSPIGSVLIRLRFYLEFVGYELAELQTMDKTVRDAARLFAFGVMSIEQIADMVGYGGKGRNGVDTLVGVFRGAHGASQEKISQFKAFVDLYSPKLAELKSKVQNVLHSSAGHPSTQPTPLEEFRPRQQLRTIGNSHDAIIEALAIGVKAILPLAEHALSDSFTAQERERVRELAGGDGVSRLSFLLTKLSGEAARSALTK